MLQRPNEIKKHRLLLGIRSGLILIGVLLWQYMAMNGSYNPIFTSYPGKILEDLFIFFTSGELLKHASITIIEILGGLFFGSLIGMALAVFLGYFVLLGEVVTPIITAISCIPQLALAPIYVLWFGLGYRSKIFLAGLMVFFNLFSATYGALRDMDKGIIESANLLGANNMETLRTVILPTCLPRILSGLRSGISAALIGAIIGEYLGSKGGLGWMITYSTSYFNISRVMSCIIVLLVLGLSLNKGLNLAEKKLLTWKSVTSLRVTNTYKDKDNSK